MMTVKDVMAPFAYSCFRWSGYAVFASSWIFVVFAGVRAFRDARSLTRRRAVVLVRKPVQGVLVFPGAIGGVRFLVRVKAVNAPVREVAPYA
jgi:hypothetical protein